MCKLFKHEHLDTKNEKRPTPLVGFLECYKM